LKLLDKIDSFSAPRIKVLISAALAVSALGGSVFMTVNENNF